MIFEILADVVRTLSKSYDLYKVAEYKQAKRFHVRSD